MVAVNKCLVDLFFVIINLMRRLLLLSGLLKEEKINKITVYRGKNDTHRLEPPTKSTPGLNQPKLVISSLPDDPFCRGIDGPTLKL